MRADAARREGLDKLPRGDDRDHVLEELSHAMGALDIGWFTVARASPVAGRTIAQSNLRSRTGAFIVAIGRGHDVTSNPGPGEVLTPDESVAVIGTPGEVEQAGSLLEGTDEVVEPVES